MVPIPLVINISLIILSICAGFMENMRIFRKDKNIKLEKTLKKAPYLYILIPLSIILLIYMVFLMIIQMKRPSLFLNLPLWIQYYSGALIWGGILSIFAYLFSLTTAIAFRSGHPEKWKIPISGILLIGVIQIAQWNYTRPIAPYLKDTIDSGITMQSNGVSCAAASAANILRVFGKQKSEKEMAELLGTTSWGTSAAQIIYGMRKTGLICKRFKIQDYDLKKVEPPAIFFIGHPSTGTESHVVAFMGLNKGKAEIWDPLMGKMLMNKRQLQDVWKGQGITFQQKN